MCGSLSLRENLTRTLMDSIPCQIAISSFSCHLPPVAIARTCISIWLHRQFWRLLRQYACGWCIALRKASDRLCAVPCAVGQLGKKRGTAPFQGSVSTYCSTRTFLLLILPVAVERRSRLLASCTYVRFIVYRLQSNRGEEEG